MRQWRRLKKALGIFSIDAKRCKSVNISENNNTNYKFFQILANYTIWDGLSQKTISRYCPFNVTDPQHWKKTETFDYIQYTRCCSVLCSHLGRRCSRCFSRMICRTHLTTNSIAFRRREKKTDQDNTRSSLSFAPQYTNMSAVDHVVSSSILCWFGLVWEFSNHSRTCARDCNLRQ